MTTPLTTVPLIAYETVLENHASGKSLRQEHTILRLNSVPDLPALKQSLAGSRWKGIIPPMKSDNWEFNATSAVMVRQALRTQRVLAPIPAADMKKAREMIQVYSAGGLNAFALPELIGGTPIQNKAGFWEMSGILQSTHWYHVMGGKGIEIPADVSGEWTWSEEELWIPS